jgi:cytochrome c oxidase subunit 3
MNSPAEDPIDEAAHRVRARRSLTYLFMVAIVMFFAALSSAYIVSRGSADYWVTFRMPVDFWYSTAIIVVSSLSVQLALRAARHGDKRATATWLVATLVLGVIFSVFQFKGWKEMSERRMNLVTDSLYYSQDDPGHTAPLNADMADHWNVSSGYFHVLTFSHWLHLAGGLVVLMVLTVRALLGRYTAQAHTGVWQGTMYWHFLTGVWIYLLLFIAAVH